MSNDRGLERRKPASPDALMRSMAEGVFNRHEALFNAVTGVLAMSAKLGLPQGARLEPFDIRDVVAIAAYTKMMDGAGFDAEDVIGWATEAIAKLKWFPSANDLVEAYSAVRERYRPANAIRDPVYTLDGDGGAVCVVSRREAERTGRRYWTDPIDAEIAAGRREPLRALGAGRGGLSATLEAVTEKTSMRALEAPKRTWTEEGMAAAVAELETARRKREEGGGGAGTL